MASAEDHSAAATGDEDLIDDDEDDDSEDDSASSAAERAHPPSSDPSVVATIGVPNVSDLHLDQHNNYPRQERQEIVVAKKPAQLDDSRKLFQRLWTDEDEIELLQGFLDYTTQRGGPYNSSHPHHHDTTAFYDQIKSKFQLDFNKNQLVEKLRRLKKKYRNVISKSGPSKEHAFRSPHDQAIFEISAKIWGSNAVDGSSASRANSLPVDEDEDDTHNLNCQSPNPSGIDVNSKTPRSRKRSRAGAIKLEDKPQQQHAFNSNSINNHPPAAEAEVAAAPEMGTSIAGSLSGVIEETVKSCLSPIFKELLGNSMHVNQNLNGLCNAYGLGTALSPISLSSAGSIGGVKMADDKWRKQQILELEVLYRRLELVQDQIDEQLGELRSIRH